MFLATVAKAIETEFIAVEPALAAEAVKLLRLIFESDDPRSKLAEAQRVLITDAANAAADEALRALLPNAEPPKDPAQ